MNLIVLDSPTVELPAIKEFDNNDEYEEEN